MQIINLRHKLALLILVTIIPAIILTVLNIRNQYKVSRENSIRNINQVVDTFSAEQSQTIEGARQLLISLSIVPSIRNLDADSCEVFLSELLGRYKRYANFSVANKNGDVICSSVIRQAKVNVFDTKIFKNTLKKKGFAVGEYQIGRITKKPVLNFGHTIVNTQGKTVGVVFSSLDLSWVNEFLVKSSLGEGSILMLLDQNETILARNTESEKWVGKSFSTDQLIQKALDKNNISVDLMGVDGIKRLYTFKRLSGENTIPVIMVVGIPQDLIFQEANKILLTSLGFLLLTLGLIIVISWKIGNLFLLKQIEDLQLLDEQKNEFVSTASHQLRTPLSGTRMLLEILLGEDLGILNKKQKELTRDINESNNRMIALVNALLDVSKIELRKINLNPEIIEIKEVLEACLKELKLKMTSKKIISTLIGKSDLKVFGDKKFITQAFLNLIDNAIKYSPIKTRISISLSKKDRFAVIKVTDVGFGITNEEKDWIFQKFHRGKNDSDKNSEGSGLGLYIAKNIIEQSGGIITFKSRENKGTTFTVKLPLHND